MPLSDSYVPVDDFACDCGCGKKSALRALGVAFGEVLVTVACRDTGRLAILLYDRRTGLFHKELPSTHDLMDLSHYPCSGSCEIMASLIKVDAGQRFLRMYYYCTASRHRFARYYSISEGGYVIIPRPGRIARNKQLPGWGRFRGQEGFTEDWCTFYTNPSDYSDVFEAAFGQKLP